MAFKHRILSWENRFTSKTKVASPTIHLGYVSPYSQTHWLALMLEVMVTDVFVVKSPTVS